MREILVFSFFPSFTPPSSGGESRLYNFYFDLSRFCKVTLISSSHLSENIEEINHTNNFKEIRVGKDNFFVQAWSELMPHKGDGDLSGPALAASSKYFTRLHNIYMEYYDKSDVIIHESPFLYDYDFFKYSDKKIRIYNSYNCEYLLYKELHKNAKSNIIEDLVKSLEIRMLNEVDLITYCSEYDLHQFEKLVNKKIENSLHVPNGITSNQNDFEYLRKKNHVVFMGSSHLPNRTAANFIVNNIASKCPEYNFDIIGNCLDEGSYPKNIFRHGLLTNEKKNEVLRSAALAINPLDAGSGSSLKNFDYISHDLPVLSTETGMRGVALNSNDHYYVAAIDEFPKKINELLKSPIEINNKAKFAKKFVLEIYSWVNIAKNFHECISKLSTKKVSPTLLVLNDYNPFVGTGGGCTRIRGLYLNASRSFNIIFLNFSNNGFFEVKNINDKITQINIPKDEAHIEEENELNTKFHISANDILAYKYCAKNILFSKIYQRIRIFASIIICEHPYMSSLPEKFNDAFIYSSQNFETGLKKDALEWHPNKEMLLNLVIQAEKFCCESSSLIFSVSDEDANSFIQSNKACAPIITIRNGCAEPAEPTEEDFKLITDSNFKNSVVFIGSSHMPNVDAGKYIIENLAPACPNINFHIIGSVCDALRHNVIANVIYWGEVSNKLKSAIMGSCYAALNPVFSGSGSNVKMADYFANGLHVFTTEFGIRGYPEEIREHISIVDQINFDSILLNNIQIESIIDPKNKFKRKILFKNYLSVEILSEKFINSLVATLKEKKKVLFVTYRFTTPPLGGAESMLLNLISRLDKSNKFLIDVIHTNVTQIQDNFRFNSEFSFVNQDENRQQFNNTRFLKCDFENKNNSNKYNVKSFWLSQPEFEKKLFLQFNQNNLQDGLAWGWCSPQVNDEESSRWTLNEFGVFNKNKSNFIIRGFVPSKKVLRILNDLNEELFHGEINEFFELKFVATGVTHFYFSNDAGNIDDPRPLGAFVNHVLINEVLLDLSKPTLLEVNEEDLLTNAEWMKNASDASRNFTSLNLSKNRGPDSNELESYIINNVDKYDLVLTHNVVFNAARLAIEYAFKKHIPSILIPHAHLDDDFYHFTDHYEMAKQASLVLASPKEACKFYEKLGVKNVTYLPAGIDTREKFSMADISEFISLYNKNNRFFLVLGRKSGAKGYQTVIEVIEKIGKKLNISLVMIGPDDDGFEIKSNYVTYLGMQPRSIVRGALQSCIALINMSTSESFGIVLLEAWLANKPVIANKNCKAFHDLVKHEENGLLVDNETLLSAIEDLSNNTDLCERLAIGGKKILENYSWDSITEILIKELATLTKEN